MRRGMVLTYLAIIAASAFLLLPQAAAYEFVGPNVLEVNRYKTLEGTPDIFTNASGIYVSGSGTMLLELDIAANSTLLFTSTVPSGFVSVLGDPYQNGTFASWASPESPFSGNYEGRLTSVLRDGYYHFSYIYTFDTGATYSEYHSKCSKYPYGNRCSSSSLKPPSTASKHFTYLPGFRHYEQVTSDSDHILRDIDYAVYLHVNATGPIHIRAENHTESNIRPPGVVRSTLSVSNILLDWECPIYDGLGYTHGCSNISNFTAYRNGTELATTASRQHLDTTIAEDTVYRYCVTSTNTNNVTSGCLNHDVRTGTLPAAPAVPHAAFDGSAVRLSWERPFSVLPISQYEIDRDGSKSFAVRGESFSDAVAPDAPTTYAYKVRALNPFGWSPWSPPVDVPLPAGRMMAADAEPVFDQYLFTVTVSSEDYAATLAGLTFSHGDYSMDINRTQSVPAGSSHTQSHLLTVPASAHIDVTARFADGIDLTRNVRLPEPALNTTHGAILAQYGISGGDLALNLKRSDGAAFAEINCRYSDLGGNHTWYNGTAVQVYMLRHDDIRTTSSYVDCFDGAGDTIYSQTIRNIEFGLGGIHALNEIFGSLFGMPIAFFIVVFVAATFTARNAHVGVIIIGFLLAIMMALGLVEISAELFGLVVALIVLGMLVGKKLHF